MISIYVHDEDRAYASALSKQLAYAYKGFSVTLGDMGAAIPGGVDCILLGVRGVDVSALSELPGELHGKAIILSDKGALFSPGAENASDVASVPVRILYKYAGVSSIAAEIRALCSEQGGGGRDSLRNAAYSVCDTATHICVANLHGGAGATCVSIAIGKEMALHHGKRVLYLCFDRAESDNFCLEAATLTHLKNGFAHTERRNISDYQYQRIRERAGDMRLFLESCLAEDSSGLRRFYPASGENELADMPLNECAELIKSLRELGGFDCIIIDAGQRHDLPELADVLVTVESRTLGGGNKAQKSAAALRKKWNRNGGIFAVENMVSAVPEWENEAKPSAKGWRKNAGASCEEKDEAGNRVEIPSDPAAFVRRDAQVEISLSGMFGHGIAGLTGKILEGDGFGG